MIWTWTEFEKAVFERIEMYFGSDAYLVSEYKAVETGKDKPVIDITIGTVTAEPLCFGEDALGQIQDLHSGTVNLTIKTPIDAGFKMNKDMIEIAKSCFNRIQMCDNYAKFGTVYKVSGGTDNGTKFTTIICPFTFEEVN